MKLQEALQAIAMMMVQNDVSSRVDDETYQKVIDIAQGEEIEVE